MAKGRRARHRVATTRRRPALRTQSQRFAAVRVAVDVADVVILDRCDDAPPHGALCANASRFRTNSTKVCLRRRRIGDVHRRHDGAKSNTTNIVLQRIRRIASPSTWILRVIVHGGAPVVHKFSSPRVSVTAHCTDTRRIQRRIRSICTSSKRRALCATGARDALANRPRHPSQRQQCSRHAKNPSRRRVVALCRRHPCHAARVATLAAAVGPTSSANWTARGAAAHLVHQPEPRAHWLEGNRSRPRRKRATRRVHRSRMDPASLRRWVAATNSPEGISGQPQSICNSRCPRMGHKLPSIQRVRRPSATPLRPTPTEVSTT